MTGEMDISTFIRPVGFPQLGSLADTPAVLVVLFAVMAVMALEHLVRTGLADDPPLGIEGPEPDADR